MPLNTEQKINTIITTLSQNPSSVGVLGFTDQGILKSLKFLEKSSFTHDVYIKMNNPLVGPVENWFNTEESIALIRDFSVTPFNYSGMSFHELLPHSRLIHNGLIPDLRCRLYTDLITFLDDTTEFQLFMESFDDLTLIENNIEVDFNNPEYFTSQEIPELFQIDFSVMNLQEFEDLNTEIPANIDFFFESMDFALNLGRIHDYLFEINQLNISHLNFINFNNSICQIYDNVRSIKIGDSILPFYFQNVQINIFEHLTTLDQLNNYMAQNRGFNTDFKLNVINILGQYGIDMHVSLIILQSTYDFEVLASLNLIN